MSGHVVRSSSCKVDLHLTVYHEYFLLVHVARHQGGRSTFKRLLPEVWSRAGQPDVREKGGRPILAKASSKAQESWYNMMPHPSHPNLPVSIQSCGIP